MATKTRRIRIVQDDSDHNPRTDYDPFGTMVCWHRRYTLGDEQPTVEPDVWLAENANDVIKEPLYLYDHSGLTMSTTAFHCPWDSGQVGWIYVRRDNPNIGNMPEKRVREYLKIEVKEYDYYLRGEVYGFVIEECNTCEHCEHETWEEVDSCWGFFGTDVGKNGIKDAIGDDVWDSSIIIAPWD